MSVTMMHTYDVYYHPNNGGDWIHNKVEAISGSVAKQLFYNHLCKTLNPKPSGIHQFRSVRRRKMPTPVLTLNGQAPIAFAQTKAPHAYTSGGRGRRIR